MFLQFILCQVVILLSVEFHTASCDTFYIVPTPSSHCPGEFTGVPCLTLDQYASNSSRSRNIAFLVEPGTFNLSTHLTVSNRYNFTMSSTNATVVCTSSAAQFVFSSVENVHISGMTFHRCRNGAIQISRVTMANIVNSYFNENGYSIYSSTSRGGLYVTTSTVSVTDCRFENNQAYRGGAIYAESSEISINGSTFNYNRVRHYGGGIYSYYSTITVDGSTHNQNSAGRDGGAIYNYRGYICTTNTVFSYNRARNGGAMYMYMYRSFAYSIIRCHFINNFASASGGAVYKSGSNNVLVVERNYYENNRAGSFLNNYYSRL